MITIIIIIIIIIVIIIIIPICAISNIFAVVEVDMVSLKR